MLLVVAVVSVGVGVGDLTAAATAASATAKSGGGISRTLYRDGSRYLTVEVLADDVVHFETGVGSGDATQPIAVTPMIAKTDFAGPSALTAHERGVETPAIDVTVDAQLCVHVRDKLRAMDLGDVCPWSLETAWKGLRVTSPATRHVYGLGQYFAEAASDGDWLGRIWDPLADGYGARLRPFAGGNNDFSMFPIMYALGDGRASYALFVDQLEKQLWDFRASPWRVEMWGEQVRWYVLAGEDLPALRRRYLELTGRPPVPPRRSFGLWVSEFGFANWGEVDAELAHLRQSAFPIEGFALDLQWFGGTFGDPDHSRMGSLRWNESAFPAPRDKVAALAADGVHLMPIEEPYIAKTVPEYDLLAAAKALVKTHEGGDPTYLAANPWWGRGGMVDFTDPAASAYWHDLRRQNLVAMGIHDHWADLGEPEQYDASSWYYGFPERNLHAHLNVHNLYGFRWMESIAAGYARHATPERPLLLSRTGTSGIQRFGVAMWSGDIGAGWGNLRSQMNAQMHMSLSNIDYYGSDAGGFQPGALSAEGGRERLYTQWFAASAALDVPVRPHAWNLDKARPTSPSRRGDPAANLESLRRRYALTPYYYSLAFAAHETGDPVFPPLVYYYQEDPSVRRLGSEKMIGRDLLVALAADPDATSLDVYLPHGEWVDFQTHEVFGSATAASGTHVVGYPLYPEGAFRLPLFARRGAIVPMQVVSEATRNNAAGGPLVVTVFPSAEASSFTLVEDDGTTFAAAAAPARTRLAQQQIAGDVTLDLGATQGTYPGMAAARATVVTFAQRGDAPASVRANGQTLEPCATPVAAPCYEAQPIGLVVRLAQAPVTVAQHVEASFAAKAPEAASLTVTCRRGDTTPGESIYAVGNVPELGAWAPDRGVRLAPGAYPTWSRRLGGLPRGATLAWKCVRRRDDGTGVAIWQGGANNVAATPAVGGFGGETAASF